MPKTPLILGLDEAGRGSWAGPVAAGACVFLVPRKQIPFYRDLDDSKKLTLARREYLFEQIRAAEQKGQLVFGVGIIDSVMIDTVGIREANRLAMAEAMRQVFSLCRDTPWRVSDWIDGRDTPRRISTDDITKIQIDGRDNYRFEGIDQNLLEYIVRGDGFIKEIQAASIVAKVTRDRMMVEYSKIHPEYGFERHKGYGTTLHQISLDAHGPIAIHRKSYAPVKKLILWAE